MRIASRILVFGCVLLSIAGSTFAWTQQDFIITVWCSPPTGEPALTNYAAENYNTMMAVGSFSAIQSHGLRAWLLDSRLNPSYLDDPVKLSQLDALIDQMKGHPAMDCYHLYDEPSVSQFAGLGRLVAHLKQKDPDNLAYINLFPTYASNAQLGTSGDTVTAYKEYLRQFILQVKPELLSYDHYHFFKTSDGDQYFLNLELIREAAKNAGIPFLNIVQASNFENMWRPPNANEMRFLVYTTLSYGARGISYFTYWGPASYQGLYIDGKAQPRAAVVAALNGEIRAVAPQLMGLDSIALYHTGTIPWGATALPTNAPIRVTGTNLVVGVFGTGGKASTYMIVNRNYMASVQTKITLASGKMIEEFDRVTHRWVKCTPLGSSTTVVINPGDGRMFREAVAGLSAHVILGDYRGDVANVSMSLRLRNSAGTVQTKAMTVDSAGMYSVVGVLPGTYELALKASHWLQAVVPNIQVKDYYTTLVDFPLINGDINGDNSVGLADLGIVKAGWGWIPGQPKYDAKADLNGDTKVGVLDLGIIKANWGKQGDP